MAASHTPGPWTVRTNNTSTVEIIGARGIVVCEASDCSMEDVANVNLIAAAPELLDELQKAHQIILNALSLMTLEQKGEWARKNSETQCIGDGTTRFHERAEVIAKATGGAA